MSVSDSKTSICTDSLAPPLPPWRVWSLSEVIAGRQRGLWDLYDVELEDLDRAGYVKFGDFSRRQARQQRLLGRQKLSGLSLARHQVSTPG